MSSLIVVCSHCLTWAEPQADCCTECGVVVDIDAPDAEDARLTQRLGEPLVELGLVRLERRGWPSLGTLVGTTEGLLFVPRLKSRPNGAIEAIDEDSRAAASSLAIWLSSWRRFPAASSSPSTQPGEDSSGLRPPREMLFDSPGALFVQRTTIRRALIQWGCLRLVRPPSKSVTFAPVSTSYTIRQLMRPLGDFVAWRNLIAGL